ncbi:hypothetical protein APUTEX25_000159 [Auxenochlorella protothecoides]|uniref:Uncharacterized protein n=1 Tax=Auxenochlorella protothecoides TaxID=3075 RepID=A0A3M7L294_AUXPR|nr:hypothetical protein APUTEX25_000159 [Auxenochlorella protothecoides]|eukprot:RMZ55576.1 hypothetical protein APUTEX25_000159 [Auxenochlorella protothecoides]
MGKRKSGASSTFPETIAQQPAQLRSAAGPYAVYFPSGYDPATGVKWETYTHAKKRHSLIVGRTDSVDFVGGSMGGEHSTAPPCRYPGAGAAERWVQAPGQRDLMLSWMVAAALRAEPSASLDGAEAEALAATLQLRLAALAERCRELGATTSTTGAHGAKKTRVTLLPPSAEARTLASYFPGLKMEKKRAGRG